MDESLLEGTRRSPSSRPELLRAACSCFLCLVVTIGSFSLALARQAGCSLEALVDKTPPFEGQLFPDHILLVERRNPKIFQMSKLIDVYDLRGYENVSVFYSKFDPPEDAFKNGVQVEDLPRLGNFYDMNFIFFMRFGYSDANDQIWFEANYLTFMDRFWPSNTYRLARCDEGEGRGDGIGSSDLAFDIHRRYWEENGGEGGWYCLQNCEKLFDVIQESLDPSQEGGMVAQATFNSTFERLNLQGYWGYGGYWEHIWQMTVADPATGQLIAKATQFYGMGQYYKVVSRWHVNMEGEQEGESQDTGRPKLPNWILSFLAALDDVETEKD